MPRLREKIKPPQTLDLIPALDPLPIVPHEALDQPADIPGLRVHVATHITDPLGRKGEQLLDEVPSAALPAGVQHDGVSSGAKWAGMEAKRSRASPARKVVVAAGRALRAALVAAEAMDWSEMSMPREWVKRAERVTVKKAEPQ
ncbi:hypothetical protein Tdes44962_MAKER09863 [Teratosphaeria destructans]|uniref:Uncharacterized protein n=1 Tax=Teratosphaeria destructans TaxID=418781 RepID=A0A9W7SQU3_9PEZI|nr:hypothetical protein Tdes44962_MAKER09863 [Teratosphaeria destructans]